MYRVIQFKEKARLKVHIDVNTELRKKAKIQFEKNFFKLMNNSVSGKTMKNVTNHKDIRSSEENEQHHMKEEND